jgi:hypothetical protein
MKLRVLIAALAVAILPAASQAATDVEYSYCAKVKKTSDGFLALRQEPTSKSPMKAILLTDWEIVLDNKFAGATGDWVQVTYVNQLEENRPVDAKPIQGWVFRKYVKIYECGC